LKSNSIWLTGSIRLWIILALFLCVNIFYHFTSMDKIFFNLSDNGDEFYQNHVYDIGYFDLAVMSSSRSQPFLFVSSLIDSLLDNPRFSTRLVSLISGLFVIVYFVKVIVRRSRNTNLILAICGLSIFVSSVVITNQIFIGTPDFLASTLLVFGIYLIIEKSNSLCHKLSIKWILIVGFLFGLSVATRPTMILVLFCLVLSIILFLGINQIVIKNVSSILLGVIVTLTIINLAPILTENKIILDVKSIPQEFGVTWFDRNYLMAKMWDEGTLSNKIWLSTQDVIDFRKNNPHIDYPSNQVEFMINDTSLFLRQMFRMFTMGIYSSIRYLYFVLPIVCLSVLLSKRLTAYGIIEENPGRLRHERTLKILFLTFIMSLLCFSFLAVKLLEFRWLIPIFIVLSIYSINYLRFFSERFQRLLFELSFLLSIILYARFFFINGIA